jgi:hypothetical protein
MVEARGVEPLYTALSPVESGRQSCLHLVHRFTQDEQGAPRFEENFINCFLSPSKRPWKLQNSFPGVLHHVREQLFLKVEHHPFIQRLF